jgi:hypothetical protein
MTSTLNLGTPEVIDKIVERINANEDERVVLLRQREVVQWLFGDTSFLPAIVKKNKTQDTKKLKVLEDTWGRATLKSRRPDLKLDKQWTGIFGEVICSELQYIAGKDAWKPVKKNHHCPDWETELCMLEAKTETHYTTGTAGEKIMGVPHKYRNVPVLYGKPLQIVCMGGAEKSCIEEYGVLPGEQMDELAKALVDFHKRILNIEFVGATDILKSMIDL